MLSTAGNDHLTVSNSSIYCNFNEGIYIQTYSDFVTISNNQIFSNGSYGIDLEAPDGLISGNSVHNHTNTGIYTNAIRIKVLNNTVFNNTGTGIFATASSGDPTFGRHHLRQHRPRQYVFRFQCQLLESHQQHCLQPDHWLRREHWYGVNRQRCLCKHRGLPTQWQRHRHQQPGVQQ